MTHKSLLETQSRGAELGGQVTVLACQLDIPADMQTALQRDLHLQRTAELLDKQLQQQPADIVLLPELSSISYSRHCFSKPAIFAEQADGISFDFLAPVAKHHGVTLLYGAPRIVHSGAANSAALTICQFIIDANGQPAGGFDKLHLAQYGASMEKDYFQRGQGLYYFDVNGMRMAPQICYDMRFADFAKTLAVQHEVKAVLHCVAFYRDESFYSWPSFVVARAMENQIYWLSLNRAGENFGGSVFCAPWVDEETPLQVLGSAEECLYIDIQQTEIDRIRGAYTFTSDRLADYSGLHQRNFLLQE